MDMIKTIKEWDLRKLLLKCYKKCIAEEITDEDILVRTINNITNITISLPEGKQPTFRVSNENEIPEKLYDFGYMIKDYSFNKLKINQYSYAFNNFLKKLISIDISCNYQIEK